MDKFQVQYKYATKTFLDDFFANSYQDIIDFFDNISACEITEIRQYEYENNTYPIDDENYIKYCTVNLADDTKKYTFRITKIKKSVNETELLNYIKQFIKVHQNIPKTAKLTYKY